MKLHPSVLLFLCLGGCGSNGLLQTAHTVAPANVRLALGASEVSNELSSQLGRPSALSVSAEVGGRLGLAKFLDIGVAPFLRSGGAVDFKANLIPNSYRFALAPRIRGGYAEMQGSSTWLAEGGLIMSYRFFTSLEPYIAVQYANHWIRYPIQQIELTERQMLVGSDGQGDALLKGHVGMDINLAAGFGVIAEYSYWRTLHNDPGDGFKFLDNHVYSCALRFEGGR